MTISAHTDRVIGVELLLFTFLECYKGEIVWKMEGVALKRNGSREDIYSAGGKLLLFIFIKNIKYI